MGGLDPVAAEELWRRVKAEPAPAPATSAAALASIASAWGVALTAQRSEPVAPTDHLVVVGASAIAATIEAFAAGAALDWSEVSPDAEPSDRARAEALVAG